MRPRSARRVLVIVGSVAGALGLIALVLITWLWRQVTALPEWYAEDLALEEGGPNGPGDNEAADDDWIVIPEDDAASTAPAPEATGAVNTKKHRAPRGGKHQLRNFHLRSKLANEAWRPAFRASRATLDDGDLEGGMIVNLSKVESKAMNHKERRFLKQIRGAFPGLRGRDVYVGIETTPKPDGDGYLRLGPDTTLRIGNLRYSLSSAAKRLGAKEADVRREINREMRRLKLRDPNAVLPPADAVSDREKSEI